MSEINTYVIDVCKVGQMAKCCRYLVFDKNGFGCAKNTSMKKIIDEKVKTGQFTAQGDNCPGKEDKFLN